MRPAVPRHPLVLLVFALAVAAVLASGSVLAHTHGDRPGLYNEEHDLTSLATFGGPAALVATAPAIAPTPAAADTPCFVVRTVADAPALAAASRAPPIA